MRKGAFQKGVSGNPSGRPKVNFTLRNLCQAETERNVATLIRLRDSSKVGAATRVAAISILLDRAWGKPLQTTENHNFTYCAVEMSDDELAGIIAGERGEGDSAPSFDPAQLN